MRSASRFSVSCSWRIFSLMSSSVLKILIDNCFDGGAVMGMKNLWKWSLSMTWVWFPFAFLISSFTTFSIWSVLPTQIPLPISFTVGADRGTIFDARVSGLFGAFCRTFGFDFSIGVSCCTGRLDISLAWFGFGSSVLAAGLQMLSNRSLCLRFRSSEKWLASTLLVKITLCYRSFSLRQAYRWNFRTLDFIIWWDFVSNWRFRLKSLGLTLTSVLYFNRSELRRIGQQIVGDLCISSRFSRWSFPWRHILFVGCFIVFSTKSVSRNLNLSWNTNLVGFFRATFLEAFRLSPTSTTGSFSICTLAVKLISG